VKVHFNGVVSEADWKSPSEMFT